MRDVKDRDEGCKGQGGEIKRTGNRDKKNREEGYKGQGGGIYKGR